MFERLTEQLGLQFAKLQFRSQSEPPRQMTGFLRTANHVLITLPIQYDAAAAAGAALQQIRNQLSQAHITLVHTSTWETPLTGYLRCEVVRIDRSDINRFSLPKKSLLQRISTHPYEVAIDLNLDFVLHTAYICRASAAAIRVGCVSDKSDIFFNVLIRPSAERSGHNPYDAVTAALAMF